MRRPDASWLFGAFAAPLTLVAFACSDHAGNPTLTDNPRIYSCTQQDIPEKLGEPTFQGLYEDYFRVHGVAACQTSVCHGSSNGISGLAMQDSHDGQNPAGVWCGLTKHQFDAESTSDKPSRTLVKSTPGVDTTAKSTLLEVVGPDPQHAYMPLSNCGANRKLTTNELGRIAEWLRAGAPWGYDTLATPIPVPKCSDDGAPCDQAPKGAAGCE